jgi:hypothetical protein
VVRRYLKSATFIQAIFSCVVNMEGAIQNFHLALFLTITDRQFEPVI